MKRIPIAAAKRIADQYDYDQVIIIARKVGVAPDAHGEHITSYGASAAHCASAELQVEALKRFMGWPPASLPEQVAVFSGPPDVRAVSTAPAGSARPVKCLECGTPMWIASMWNVAMCNACLDKGKP